MVVDRVLDEVQQISATLADEDADRVQLTRGFVDITKVRSWLAAAEAEFATRMSRLSPTPEHDIADATRGSTRDVTTIRHRATTLGNVQPLADALSDGAVTTGHIDVVTRVSKQLDTDQERSRLFEKASQLTKVAEVSSVEAFHRRLKREAQRIQADDGMDRLERQQRNTRLRTWVDADGMWRFDGRFDPVTGVKLDNRLSAAVNTLFAESVPKTCPSDSVNKQHHLRALALARLVCEPDTVGSKPGRPEFIAVINADQPNGRGEPVTDLGIPVEVPYRVLAELAGDGDAEVKPIVIRNGLVIHAPGRLDLGRSTRLASPAQRRALRAMYPTCAIPGCEVPFRYTKAHHVTWWRNGGETNLNNLLPVCSHHHTMIHDGGWQIELDKHRALTITLPDGNVLSTGPPGKAAA
ncbi:MAG: HNH endonuclease [Ilumatobacter coccineus]|uniref:HNH endonuclease n=1 Tax=Ilumatobacter coccineus TaxID=467094 RepID=A0A2G6KA11_9ACTN|nr:MAG: HNH endonuclease [Ilumatobacter coccineus]